MRKSQLMVFTAILALSLSVITPASIAGSTQKPTIACKKLNQSITLGGYKFTCVKVGKKLSWSAGVRIPTPTSTISESAFKAPIPMTLPLAPVGQITFDNILNNISNIPQVAFDNEQHLLDSNSMTDVKHDIFLAPTLENHYSLSDISAALDRAIKFYTGFQNPTYFGVYIFDNEHVNWAETQYQSVANEKSYSSVPNYFDTSQKDFTGICPSADCTSNVAALVRGTNDDYMGIGVDNGFHDIISEGGLAHSYGHLIEKAQWDNSLTANLGKDPSQFMPYWFFEGGINQPSWFLSGMDFNYYQDARNNQAYNLRGVPLKNFSTTAMTNYLLTGTSTQTIDDDGNIIQGSGAPGSIMSNLGNSLGGIACEALIAIGGGQSVMSVIASIANGDSWPVAFQKVYGISWDKAAPIIGAVMAAEYAAHPPQ